MDFEEYMLAIHASTLSSPEEKLNWIFNVFDKDGGGSIDAKEIAMMMSGLYQMAGVELEDEEIRLAVEDVLTSIDEDGDGDVTKDEWLENAMKSKYIASLLLE